MYKLVIERFEKNEHGTFSKAYLYKNDELICDKFKTLAPIGEPTYQSNLNKPIPKDIYNARWRYSPKFSPKLNMPFPILSNERLSESRCILIHNGSEVKHTQGCELLAYDFIINENDELVGVRNSIVAIKDLYKMINKNDFVVEVVDAN